MQFTSFPHQGRNFTKRINVSTEALFPHDTDCLTTIVPRQGYTNHFLRKTTKNADTIAICLALVLFIICRMNLQKEGYYQVFMISFNTIGVFLNQIRIPNDNRIKVAWDINLRGFSLLATTALSAIVFKSLITASSNEINTIDDLIESNLTIFAPDYLKNQDIWQYIRYTMSKRWCQLY